ncbi:pseudouridine synthase [Gautieria morchelliformis]|nr:pseudouridine synthase [Gautieria morchelliformis]
MSNTGVRERETNDAEKERLTKRVKMEHSSTESVHEASPDVEMSKLAAPESKSHEDDLLPPSRSLLPCRSKTSGDYFRVSEPDVGISVYIANDIPKIQGIIKQRFTDFLVYEVDLQGQVVRLKSIDEPEAPTKNAETGSQDQMPGTSVAATELSKDDAFDTVPPTKEAPKVEGNTPSDTPTADAEPWPTKFTNELTPLLSQAAIEKLKEMFLQGPEPPFVSDSGWGDRQSQAGNGPAEQDATVESAASKEQESNQTRGKNRMRGRKGKERNGRGRGGKGVRGGREDNRKVLSDPISSKQERTALHEIIRTLFRGKLETETDPSDAGSEAGQRIVIKWSKTKGGSVKRGNKEEAIARGGRGNPFNYIHFNMQKTNRDAQDSLSHLSRLLHVPAKDLSVAGTKDKRGVTTQRVSFKRNGKTIQDVWKTVNGITSRRTVQQATTERGERGIRIGDLAYRKGFLELGMLRGNAFVITLRNVKVDSAETMDRALNSLKENGFINYYGMQRFGTASIPTHSIGLALLRSDWTGAISLILRPRPGEYPEADAARHAWLDERDLDKALLLMPRRVVAERCILESYKKQGGDDRNALGALSTIPKNLRLMYVHAYQSYVWNAIVSERMKTYGGRPLVGDLVFDTTESVADEIKKDQVSDPTAMDIEVDASADIDDESAGPVEDEKPILSTEQSNRKGPRVKVLGADDLDKYTIFDVIMPLPGTDVAYPEGALGEKYREFLRLDGLDPNNFHRKQRDYTLGGSYRKILHVPKHISWSTMRYTDPDVALAQSDEDQLLGFDPPVTDENGPFLALQIRMQLGTAAYATMALREVTKTETSSHHQSALTQVSDDQKFKGTGE